MVKVFLEPEGYHIIPLGSGMEVLDYLSSHSDVDLILLDVMMPGLDGFETCREIKEHFSIPVIMITALGDEEDEVYGINNGADDYISKPFSKALLTARIKAILRLNQSITRNNMKLQGILFNEDNLSIEIDDKTVQLSPKEYALLILLINNSERTLSRDIILNSVWGYSYDGDPRTVDTHIKSLRSKIGKSCLIKTVRNRGYCWTGSQH